MEQHFKDSRQRKKRTTLELSGDGGRARLVDGGVLVCTCQARAQSEPLLLQGRAQAAWLRVECDVPSVQEVMRDDRFA